MFLRNTAGTYEPAFFIIRIDAEQPPEQLIEANKPTFVHEYLHLLQDLVLPYCMRENIALLETFLLQIHNARLQGEMRLPSDYSDEHVRLLRKIGTTTWGGNSFHENVSKIDRIDLYEESVEGKEYRLQKYVLSANGVCDYHLGARDLLEYIASKIESRHFPAEANLPDLPYRSVDLVLAHEGLAHLSDVKRIALVEYCLMNDNPIHRLMVVLRDIKAGMFSGADYGDDDAFIALLLKLEWRPNGAPFRTMADKLTQRYEELKITLQRQFPAEAFPAIYVWLDEALEYAKGVLAGRSIFSVLYEMDAAHFHDAMNSLVERIGVPLIVNRRDRLGTTLGDTSSKNQFIQLLLAYEFSEYLKRDEPTCPFYSRCEMEAPELLDETNCMDAPFRRALDAELCPFGAFVKTLGLSEVRWYARDRLIPSWRAGPY